MVSSHIPDEGGMGLAVDIECTNSLDRYELVEVAQKFFKRIGIAGEHSGNFIHWMWIKQNHKRCCGLIEERRNPSHTFLGRDEKGFYLLLVQEETYTQSGYPININPL